MPKKSRRWRRASATVVFALVAVVAALADEGHSTGDDCASSPSFAGEKITTAARSIARYMMVSAWHLEPYSDAYLDNVLSDLARHRTAGIVYGTLGATTVFLRQQGAGIDEATLNESIYRKAQRSGADLWLQLRIYDNQLMVDGASARNVTAEEIMANPAAGAAYREALARDVQLYDRYFRQRCVVIVFEEAGIYHAPEGGGTFWSSSPERLRRPNYRDDNIFGERLESLFREAYRTIKSVNPACSVGMHLGHSAVEDQPVLAAWFDRLAADNARPDFVFYDFYFQAQPDFERYTRKLTERLGFITGTLRQRVMHLAQLHTMNAFQHGGGRTPSREEIDRVVQLDEQLGVSGLGFYTKNALPTTWFGNGPFSPNSVGKATLYESAKDRWDYGLLKLFETSGVDFSDLFDLVVEPHGSAPVAISLYDYKAGGWTLVGTTRGSAAAGGPPAAVTVFRALDASRYMQDRRRLALNIASAESGGASMWVVPSEPASRFRTADSLASEIQRSHTVSGSRAQATVEISQSAAKTTVCIQ